MAEELFVADPEKIKHEVVDPQAQERTHPYYENLLEQKELFVQALRRQRQREVVLLPPDSDQVIGLRTLTVPAPSVGREQFEELKIRLLREGGKRVQEARRPVRQEHANGHPTRAPLPSAGAAWNRASSSGRQPLLR